MKDCGKAIRRPPSSTVPTALQRAGRLLANQFASTAALITIYDPATVVTLPNGTRQRTPFPGNVIPTSRFNPVAQGASAYYPLAQSRRRRRHRPEQLLLLRQLHPEQQ